MIFPVGRTWLAACICIVCLCAGFGGQLGSAEAKQSPAVTLLLTANTYGVHSPCPT